MGIRRKSTTHDLATLRLHPDGSRVQQPSLNAGRRMSKSTVVDSRGNWIAEDAGGKTSVKTRRSISNVHMGDGEGEFIDLSGDEEQHNHNKGKERACDSQIPNEDPLQETESGRLNTRTRQRLSFMHDHSFLDPTPVSVSSLEKDMDNHNSDAASAQEMTVSFPEPAPDLLKSIHHFASCYYGERGQLSDGSRNYRGMKKEGRKKSQDNIHSLAIETSKRQNINTETEGTFMEDETTEEDEDESEPMNAEDIVEEHRTKGDTYRKDMYKAFDGSALMAIGIVLQEYVAHTLSSPSRTSEEPGSPKRRRTG